VRDALGPMRCVSCACFHQPDRRHPGVCVLNPPVPMVAGVSPQSNVLDPKAQVRLAPVVQSFYPPVQPDHGCHQHRTLTPAGEANLQLRSIVNSGGEQ